MNFGPHILTLFESPRAGVHDPKILWAKVQKWRRYGDGGKNRKTPTFVKKVKFLAQKMRLTLEKNTCIQKDYFRETKKLGVGLIPPKIFF